MASTYQTLQDKVNRRVIDLPDAVVAEVPDLVNFAHKEIQREHNFKVMEALQEANTTVDTRILAAVASDFKEHRGVPYYLQNTGQVVEIGVAQSRQSLYREFEEDGEGYPQFLYQSIPTNVSGATSWECWPLPDGNSDYTTAPSGEYRIKIPYWKFLPDFVGSSDTDWFSQNAEWYVVFRACAEAFALDWDTEKQSEYLGKAEAELKKAKKYDTLFRLSSVDTFVPHYKGAKSSLLIRR